jgi:hypothetical protein
MATSASEAPLAQVAVSTLKQRRAFKRLNKLLMYGSLRDDVNSSGYITSNCVVIGE